MFFRPTTSCKWSVCGTVTGDSWMRHRTSRYFLSAYALPTLDIFAIEWPTLGLAIHTPLQSLPTRDPSSDSACASLRDPVHQHYPRHTLQKTEASYKKKHSSRLTSCGASGNVSVALLFFSLTDGGCGCGCARPERERRARLRHDLGVSRGGDRMFGSRQVLQK